MKYPDYKQFSREELHSALQYIEAFAIGGCADTNLTQLQPRRRLIEAELEGRREQRCKSELSGVELDFYVAKAEGLNVEIGKFSGELKHLRDGIYEGPLTLKVDWSFIGPIIAKIDTWLYPGSKSPTGHVFPAKCQFIIHVDMDGEIEAEFEATGRTIEEAIKRCIVKRKYGEDIDMDGLQ